MKKRKVGVRRSCINYVLCQASILRSTVSCMWFSGEKQDSVSKNPSEEVSRKLIKQCCTRGTQDISRVSESGPGTDNCSPLGQEEQGSQDWKPHVFQGPDPGPLLALPSILAIQRRSIVPSPYIRVSGKESLGSAEPSTCDCSSRGPNTLFASQALHTHGAPTYIQAKHPYK